MIECFLPKKTAVSCCNSRYVPFLRSLFYCVSLFICVISLLVLSGCKKKKKVDAAAEQKAPASRLDDPEYVAALNAHREDQKVVARKRNDHAKEMTKFCEQVKGSMRADVSEEEFKAALETNEQWQVFVKGQERLDQDVKDLLQEARATVRERLLRDQAESNSDGN